DLPRRRHLRLARPGGQHRRRADRAAAEVLGGTRRQDDGTEGRRGMAPIDVNMVVPAAAAVFLASFALYVGVLALREVMSARTARNAIATEQAYLRERIAETAQRRRLELEKAERTWDGFRKFVIARKEMEAA